MQTNPRGVQAPNPSNAMNKYRVNVPDMIGAIWQPLYDYQTLAAAGAQSQRFFLDPLGGAAGKTQADTNMELSGQIPKGQRFLITGIQCEIYPAGTIADAGAVSDFADDVNAFYAGGFLRLRIGDKSFATQAPLMKFPPVNRLNVHSSIAVQDATIVYAAATGREFATIPLILESNQNFSVELGELAALPSGVDARIGVTLNGYLWRNAQ